MIRSGTPSLLLLLAFNAGAGLVLDSSFHPAALEKAGSVDYAVPAAEGRVLIAGSFTTVSGEPRSQLARALPDGRLDPAFNGGDVAFVTAMLPLRDGKLIMAGRRTLWRHCWCPCAPGRL